MRVMKCADQILPRAQVNGGFAADGGVHLRQYGGGNLNQVDAPHVERCHEAGDVAHHAAAEGDDDGISVGAQAAQLLGQLFHRGQLLVAFAVGHFHDFRGESGGRQRGHQLFPPLAADGRDRDHEQPLMFRGGDH